MLLPVELIKQEIKLPDKLILTLSDNGTVINVEAVSDEVINIDEDDCNIENLLAMSDTPENVVENISLPSSSEFGNMRPTQPFFEQSQATAPSISSSNVTLRKKNNRNTAALSKNNVNADFGPQLTHKFRALPVKPVVRRNAFLTANVKLLTPPHQTTPYSMSQDLSLFNSSQILKAVLQGTEAAPAPAPGPAVAAVKKTTTTSNIPVRAKTVIEKKNNVNSKQVNETPTVPQEIIQNTKKELVLYHKIKKFDYFAALTQTHVVDFELSVTPYGQSYMRTLICTGDAKFWLLGDNLESLFSYFRQDILASIRNLLHEFVEFHYDECEKETVRGIDDPLQKICHQALYHIFNTAIPISACQLQLSHSLAEYSQTLARIKRFSGVPAAKLNIQKVFSTQFMETVKTRLDQSVIIIN